MKTLGAFAVEISEEIARRDAVGFSLAVGEGGDIAEAAAWGVRRLQSDEPVTTTTLFQAGSISKPVAALGALRLVDEGTLGLDTDVNDYLTSWKLPSIDDWQPRITIRQLLTHGAGLTVHGFPGYPYGSAVPTLIDVLDGTGDANSRPVRVENLPGLNHRYSGGGYTILQQLMMDVTGVSFPKLLEDLVLGPAGMDHASYEQPLPEEQIPNATMAHLDGKTLDCGFHVYPEMAAAGLWCTPTDLARFAICIQRAIAGAPGALVSHELALEMVTPHFPGMGLGVTLQGEDPNLRFGHGGANQGFLADMSGYINHGSAYAAMTNSFAGGPLLSLARNRVGELHKWPGYVPAPVPESGSTPRELVRPYLGGYESDDGGRVDLQLEDGVPYLTVPGQSPIHLDFLSFEVSLVRGLPVEVHFDLDNGRPTALTVRQHGRAIRFSKVGEER